MNKSLLTIIGLSANLFLIGCADDQARTQIADTNVRLSKIEQQLVNSDSTASNQISTLNKLENLQNQINQLNGKVDTLSHEQKTQKETQEQMIKSLELQLQTQSNSNSNSNSNPTNNTTNNSDKQTATDVDQDTSADKAVIVTPVTNNKAKSDNATNAKAKINKSLELIKQKNFPAAIKELKSLIKTYPKSDEAIEASYYLSVCYLANKQYTDAIATARKFVNENPNNKSAPDALRTQYLAQIKAGMKQSAQKTAILLKKMYPNSSANKKVEESLKHSNHEE